MQKSGQLLTPVRIPLAKVSFLVVCQGFGGSDIRSRGYENRGILPLLGTERRFLSRSAGSIVTVPNILKGSDVQNLCSIKYYSKSENFCRSFYTAAKLVTVLQNW
jgi:hypothetical protein